MRRIAPGLVTAATADAASWLVGQTEENDRRLRDFKSRQIVTDRFPAVVTDYQPSTGRYAWTEQDFDAQGNRYTKPGGRSGTLAYSPAYSFGDNSIVTSFPLAVWMCRRVVATEASGSGIGPVYEFPLYCGCASGGSGSGVRAGGSGPATPDNVLVSCCPNLIPGTLYATLRITAGGCVCLTHTYEMRWVPFVNGCGAWFSIFGGNCGPHLQLGITLYCCPPVHDPSRGDFWILILTGTDTTTGQLSDCQPSYSNFTVTCDPFQLRVIGGTIITQPGHAACTCAGATFDFVITE